MQNAFALLRYASRLWIFVLRTTLITLGIACIAALLAFLSYKQTIAVVGQPASAQTIIGLREPIRVTFSQPMDERSVAETLRISPTTAVTLQWNQQSTEVTIVPRTQWKAESTYVVSLSQATRSATLMPIDTWSMQFTTRAVLRVTQFFPAHLSTDVATDTLVVVRFSQQMVPQSAIHIPLSAPLLYITPAIPTTQEWIDTQTLALASTSYAPNTRYTVVAPASLRDSNGRPLEATVTRTFTTRADQLNAITPADGATSIGINQPLIVTLSGTLDEPALRTAVRISPPTEVTYEIQPGMQNTSQLTVRPVQGWQYDSDYRVSFVNIGSQRISATTGFRTAPALALVAQSPPNGQPLQANRELRFVFNAPLDRATVAGAIHFSPQPVRPVQIDVRGNDIRILGIWATQTAPVVRIDTTLRSTTGNALPADILQTFAVDPRATLLTLPGTRTDIVDATEERLLRINLAPHTTAVLTLTALSPATLARVRALSQTEFAAYDPVRYGIRPFATIPITTELEPSISLDLPSLIPASMSARVVFARVVDNKGASDARFVRILPASLYALNVGNTLVVGVPPTPNTDPHRFEIYQNGAPVASGTADDQGIWYTSAIKPRQTALIFDTTVPYDVVERTVQRSESIPLLLAVLGAHDLIGTGEPFSVACARNQTTQAQSATVSVTSASGSILSARALLWNTGQRMATATLEIPLDAPPGLASVSCVSDTARDEHAVLVVPTAHTIVHIERINTSVAQATQIRLRDDAQRPLGDARIYWHDNKTFHMTRTDANGSALLPDTITTENLVILTEHARALLEPTEEGSFWIDPPASWYEAGQPFVLSAHLTPSALTPAQTTVDLTVRDAQDTIQVIRTMTPDSTGTFSTTLSLPRGQWFVVMRAGVRTARAKVQVGVLPDKRNIQPQSAPIVRMQPTRWLTTAPENRTLLVASLRDTGLQSTWADSPDDGILSTTGITDSTTIEYGYATHHSAEQSGPIQIVDPTCSTASVALQTDANRRSRIVIQAPPESVIALSATNPTSGDSLWRSEFVVPSDGMAELTDTTIAGSPFLDVRALIAHPWCQRTIRERVTLQNEPIGVIDAPPSVVLGDVVPVRYIITGLEPGAPMTVQLDSSALLITDPLPIYTQSADETGTLTFVWQMRVVREKPTLSITPSYGRPVVWQPASAQPSQKSSPDGFMLTGRTTLEAGRFDTPFDVLRSPEDVAAVLDADAHDTPTAAHLAHLIWLRGVRHDTTALQRTLFQAQRADGTWAVVPDAVTDVNITADIVSALSRVEGMQRHIVPLIPFLQRAADNPSLPLAVRAQVLYALSLQGVRADDAMDALYALRDTLGNEGLAAVLLSVHLYPEIDIAPLRTTLTLRAFPASRGIQWAVDPATAPLHSLAAQNLFIVEALVHADADPTLLRDARSYLLSVRGTGGWGDTIANARAWQMRSFLFSDMTNTQRVTVTDSSGHIISTSAIVSAQRIRGNASIWSDNPVLVGIDYPRDPVAPTHEVVLRQQWFDEKGLLITTPLRLRVGESITGVCDVVFMNAIPYTRIILPIPALATLSVNSLPNAFSIESDPMEYTFTMPQSQAGVLRISYKLTASRVGSATIPGIQVIDAAGTTLALQPTSTMYVRTP